MHRYIDEIENRMSADEKDMLRRIYAPTVVATPLGDSRRHICILKDGEIRSYEMRHPLSADEGEEPFSYLSSRDGGLSWKRYYDRGKMGSCTYLEKGDLYITTVEKHEGEHGLFVYRSTVGPDDTAPEVIRLSNRPHGDTFLPKQSAFSNRIWFTSQARGEGAQAEQLMAVFCYSDDLGKTWKRVEIARREGWEMTPPHKGMRWSIRSGVEPYAEELGEGRMMMLIRSPFDSFFVSYSEDGGESWSEPRPSTFYGTNTTPFLLRLRDGRLLAFWNNTCPLPEQDPREAIPALDEETAAGIWEDVFTNRDAAHAAVSDDGGKNFVGYREILLNPIRNHADFRYIGDPLTSRDKSVHQFQAFELPFGKILVSAGQNEAARRLLIFDVDWLYETARQEDFSRGLDGLSYHTYLRSISGCTVRAVGNGHCAWNRLPNACPMPDPDGGLGEVLYIAANRDTRLINGIGGATWNFPLSPHGSVSVSLKIASGNATLSLSDRWYNTCDETVSDRAPFSFLLSRAEIGSAFADICIKYDTEKGEATLLADGKRISSCKMQHPCPTGISYLVLQCKGKEGDGFYVRSLSKK